MRSSTFIVWIPPLNTTRGHLLDYCRADSSASPCVKEVPQRQKIGIGTGTPSAIPDSAVAAMKVRVRSVCPVRGVGGPAYTNLGACEQFIVSLAPHTPEKPVEFLR